MNTLENISVKTLFSLKPEKFDEYHSVLKNLNPVSGIENRSAKDIYELSFSDVGFLKFFVQKPTIENIFTAYRMVFEIMPEDLERCGCIQFYQSFNWLQEEILELIEGEQRLASDTEPELKEAGIEELNIFGEMNTLIAIGEQFSKSPEEVEKWSYNLVFTLSLYGKMKSEINKRYVKIINKPKQ